jgi:hypothetical protein
MKFFKPLLDLVGFIAQRSDIAKNLSIISFPIGYLLFENSLVINEELLIVLCFTAAIYFIYSEFGDSVTESLNERSDKIKKDFMAFDVIKLDHLNDLYKQTSNVLEIKDKVRYLQEFSIESIKTLDENKKQAFVGLISKNIIERLQILTKLNKSFFSTILIESFYVRISHKLALNVNIRRGEKLLAAKKARAEAAKAAKRETANSESKDKKKATSSSKKKK